MGGYLLCLQVSAQSLLLSRPYHLSPYWKLTLPWRAGKDKERHLPCGKRNAVVSVLSLHHSLGMLASSDVISISSQLGLFHFDHINSVAMYAVKLYSILTSLVLIQNWSLVSRLYSISESQITAWTLAIAGGSPRPIIYKCQNLWSLKTHSSLLFAESPRRGHRVNATHVDFGVNGNKIVTSYHAEHAYSFRIDGAAVDAQAKAFKAPNSQNESCLRADLADQSSCCLDDVNVGQPFATCSGFMPPPCAMNLFEP